VHAFFWGEAGNDIFRIGPAGNDLRADERAGLDVMQPRLGERLDQLDLVGRADRAGFNLKALARAFLVDVDMFRKIAHRLAALLDAQRYRATERSESFADGMEFTCAPSAFSRFNLPAR
jgi:hypothetical protein